MNTIKTAIIKSWNDTASIFLLIDFNKETNQWEIVDRSKSYVLKKLKLAAGFELDKPDPPNAYDLLLKEASKFGYGLETISEEE